MKTSLRRPSSPARRPTGRSTVATTLVICLIAWTTGAAAPVVRASVMTAQPASPSAGAEAAAPAPLAAGKFAHRLSGEVYGRSEERRVGKECRL